MEIEEAKEEIVEGRRKEIRRKREEKIETEINIIVKIGKSVDEREYIENMTASALAAMALEDLDHVEIIRSKCGTMQKALSGELKRKKLSLNSMVRVLQAKAEGKGDLQFLRAKIEELLKKK